MGPWGCCATSHPASSKPSSATDLTSTLSKPRPSLSVPQFPYLVTGAKVHG